MKRCAAYVLFLLACVLPSWYLRDIVAAEAQIRGLDPAATEYLPRKMDFASFFSSSSSTPYGRKLGPRGQEHLWEVLSDWSDRRRRGVAYDLLLRYHGPAITGWFIQAIGSADPLMLEWARVWALVEMNARELPDYLRPISKEDFVCLLRSARDVRTASLLIDCLWTVRPEEAERAGARWMRETTDPEALRELAWVFEFVPHDYDDYSRFPQFVLKMWRAGKEDPRHAVQFRWPELLPKPEEEHETR